MKQVVNFDILFMDFSIYSSELEAIGVNPQTWGSLGISQRKMIASKIFRGRRSASGAQLATLIETNNPNALQRLQLVWN